ncbi:MAG: restriction endonuclease subunit S, partial [Opitutaceae bacterium]|nr:restriction endonuclease subunit S [Opitutaceae bacterium]
MNSALRTPHSSMSRPGYKQTEVGVIPEEWEVVNLECAAGIVDPQPDHRTPPECTGGDPYIGISDFLDDSTINWEASRKIIPKAVDKQRARFQLRSGDIIFGKIGTIGMPKFVPAPQFRYGLSANVLLLQPKVEPFYLMAWLRSDTFQRAVNSELHSTSQAAFGINKMRRMLVPTPPPPEQRAIAEALSDVDGLLDGLDRLIAKKRDLKQAAMQQLLTG